MLSFHKKRVEWKVRQKEAEKEPHKWNTDQRSIVVGIISPTSISLFFDCELCTTMTRRPYRLFKGNNFVERPYYSMLMCERFLMQPVSKRRSVHWVYSLSHSPNVELEYSLSHIHYCFSKVLFVLRPLMISKSTLCPTSINVFQKYSFSYTHRTFSNVLFVLHKPYFEIR